MSFRLRVISDWFRSRVISVPGLSAPCHFGIYSVTVRFGTGSFRFRVVSVRCNFDILVPVFFFSPGAFRPKVIFSPWAFRSKVASAWMIFVPCRFNLELFGPGSFRHRIILVPGCFCQGSFRPGSFRRRIISVSRV